MPKNVPHTVYRLADGTRVPSVTTILSVLNKPALMHWSWKLGMDGLDYRTVRDQAADIGTLAHYLIMCELREEKADVTDYSEQDLAAAGRCLVSYHTWLKQHQVLPIHVEVPVISEVYRFGGTPDLYGSVDGKPTLVDFKTGTAIYAEAFHQVAAYATVLEELGHGVKDILILRIGKTDDEGFEEKHLTERAGNFQIFLSCLDIYTTRKRLKIG